MLTATKMMTSRLSRLLIFFIGLPPILGNGKRVKSGFEASLSLIPSTSGLLDL